MGRGSLAFRHPMQGFQFLQTLAASAAKTLASNNTETLRDVLQQRQSAGVHTRMRRVLLRELLQMRLRKGRLSARCAPDECVPHESPNLRARLLALDASARG